MDNQFENQVEVQPKNQKSGKGLAIIIIVLLFACCGVLCYFVYSLNEYNTKYKNEIKDYKAEIQKLKTETNNNIITNLDNKVKKLSNNQLSCVFG